VISFVFCVIALLNYSAIALGMDQDKNIQQLISRKSRLFSSIMLGDIPRAKDYIDSSVRNGDNLCNEYGYLQRKIQCTDDPCLKKSLESISRLFPADYIKGNHQSTVNLVQRYKAHDVGCAKAVIFVGLSSALVCYGVHLAFKAGQQEEAK